MTSSRIANIIVIYAVIIGGAMTPISHSLALLGMGIYETAVGGHLIHEAGQDQADGGHGDGEGPGAFADELHAHELGFAV